MLRKFVSSVTIYRLTVLFFLAFLTSATEHKVYPADEKCTASSCLSLEQYVRNVSQYFTDHSYFQFLPSNHHLNSTLHLENLENITLSGTVGKTKLRISGGFNYNNMKGIVMNGLDIDMIWQDECTSKFNISYSSGVLLSNIQFNKFKEIQWDGIQGLVNNSTFWRTGIIAHKSTIVFYDTLFYGKLKSGLNLISSRSTLYMSDSILIISGRLILENNAGNIGAGLFLHNSSMILRAPVQVLFVNNSASAYGAAIYVVDDEIFFKLCSNDISQNYACFFEIESNSSNLADVNLEFINNTALMAGSAVYGGDLTQCHVKINSNLLPNKTGYEVFQQISRLSRNETISSKSLSLHLCTDGVPRIDPVGNIVVVPGQSFNVSLAAMGQVNTTTAHISVSSDGLHVSIVSAPKLSAGCNDITFQAFSSKADFETDLFIVHSNICSDKIVIIYIKFKECPNGFMLERGACVCDKTLHNLSNIDCNVQSEFIENSGKLWISPRFENGSYIGVMWYEYCPYEHCKKPTKGHPIEIDFLFPNGSNSQCAKNRTGTLCGACSTGYSLSLNTLECKKCSNKTVSLILLFAVAGVGLIAVLLCLHMTVASGTLNGLILYVNIVNVHRDVFFLQDTESSGVNPLQVFISWLNLDFGIPLCFYDGLNAYQYYWLQYAFPAYLWFLTGLIIIGSKYSCQLRRLLGSNPVAVLATIILMSFNKCLQASIGALAFADLQTSEGQHFKVVWLYDGNLGYFKNKHIVLGAGAVCILIFFLLPFVILLTLGSTLQAYSDCKWFRWFNKFTPLLDAYYAPFNKNRCYWPGLMLVLRIILFLSYLISSDNLMVIVCTILTATIALQWKVFKNFYVNVLQTSFALNLCVLCVGTYHVRLYHGNQSVISDICVVVALLEFMGIVIFHICVRLKCIKMISKMSLWHKIQHDPLQSDVSIQPILEDTNSTTFREPLLNTHSSVFLD